MRFNDIVKRTPKGAIAARDGLLHYFGKEIGKEPEEQVFLVFRSAATIANASKTFQGLPVTDGHVDWDESFSIDPKAVVGRITDTSYVEHRDVDTESTFAVKTDLVFNDDDNRKDRQLSLGYDANIVESPHPELYHFVQENIKPHHLAVVDNGRCGPSCKILDAAMSKKTEQTTDPAADAAVVTKLSDEDCDRIFDRFKQYLDKDKEDMEDKDKEDMEDEEEEMEDEDECEGKSKKDMKKKDMDKKNMDAAPKKPPYWKTLGFSDYKGICDKASELGVEFEDGCSNQAMFKVMREELRKTAGKVVDSLGDKEVHVSFLMAGAKAQTATADEKPASTGRYGNFGKTDGTGDGKPVKSPYKNSGRYIPKTRVVDGQEVDIYEAMRKSEAA